VLRAALRDLQWRRRRFAIATLGTAVVFAITLILTGLSNGFKVEAGRTVSQLGADGWFVGQGATGPFLGAAPMAASEALKVAAIPGVRQAAAVVYTRKVVENGSRRTDVNVFGATVGGPGLPTPSTGRVARATDEIEISTKLKGFKLGDHLVLAGRPFVVVGKVPNSTAVAGVPNVFLTLAGAQEVAYAGQPVAAAIAFTGTPTGPTPSGLAEVGRATARTDLLRPVEQARSAVSLLSILLWAVAALIVGSMVYLSALERQRDFAIFKATGVSTSSILGGLAVQAVAISLVAAIIGGALAALLAPSFPLPVAIDRTAKILLPLLAVLVGLIASVSGLRRVIGIDPALAFRAS
jgi:putative ABC transport system permease protein